MTPALIINQCKTMLNAMLWKDTIKHFGYWLMGCQVGPDGITHHTIHFPMLTSSRSFFPRICFTIVAYMYYEVFVSWLLLRKPEFSVGKTKYSYQLPAFGSICHVNICHMYVLFYLLLFTAHAYLMTHEGVSFVFYSFFFKLCIHISHI